MFGFGPVARLTGKGECSGALDAEGVAPAAARKTVSMQSVLTLALVRSSHQQWDALYEALAPQSNVRIVGDVHPMQPLCVLAGYHPTVMLV